ncbi:MAG: TonB-dependent receptor [Sulfurimonas sp.]|nr:TonB-dependent receptor [Sulfurimonas sp.]
MNILLGLTYIGPYEEKLTSLYGKQGVFNLPGNQSQISFYLQDLYHVYSNLDFSCNIRYDNYDYFTPMLSYRAAFVYSQDDTNIYKLIYSHSYRLPSYNEAFGSSHFGIFVGNPSLKPESVTTTELSYTYVKEQQRLHINTYYSIYKDAIDASFDDKFIIDNIKESRYSYGAELEYTHNFKNDKKLIFEASYTQYIYKNISNNQNIQIKNPNISPITGSLAYIHSFSTEWTASTKIDYYSKKSLLKAIKQLLRLS